MPGARFTMPADLAAIYAMSSGAEAISPDTVMTSLKGEGVITSESTPKCSAASGANMISSAPCAWVSVSFTSASSCP